MNDETAAFLAQMLLKLVPLGDKYVDGVGVQLSGAAPLFTADEVKRLYEIASPRAQGER